MVNNSANVVMGGLAVAVVAGAGNSCAGLQSGGYPGWKYAGYHTNGHSGRAPPVLAQQLRLEGHVWVELQ